MYTSVWGDGWMNEWKKEEQVLHKVIMPWFRPVSNPQPFTLQLTTALVADASNRGSHIMAATLVIIWESITL